MSSYESRYAAMFEALGFPLSEQSAVAEQRLADAESRLGVTVPAALREYYAIAGGERRINQCEHRLLPPERWSINKKHLLFMEENQKVLWWGVSLNKPHNDDPNVFQGINAEQIVWRPENQTCSAFLEFMLHYHAANGGLPYGSFAFAGDDSAYRLEGHGWQSRGELGQTSVYSRPGQVLCLTPPGHLPFMRQWKVTIAANTEAALNTLQKEIGLAFN